MKYYLITTSDVRSWKFDRKVLFLGEWCINNENKKHLINLDYKIMPPIEIDGNTRKKFIKNRKIYTYFNAIDFKIFE